MATFITAVGLVLVIEGLLYGAFPSAAKNLAELMNTTPEDTIRLVGLCTAALGLFVVWLSLP